MQNQDNTNLIYGGFFVRLAAYFIDILLMGTLLLVIKIPFLIAAIVNSDNILQKPLLFKFSAADIFFYLLGVLYFVLMTYLTGATIGKKLLRLRVISSDQSKLTLFDVIYRETIGRYLSTVILWIGYFLIGVDKEKRALHDMLCDTKVVYDFSLEAQTVINEAPNLDVYKTQQSAVSEEDQVRLDESKSDHIELDQGEVVLPEEIPSEQAVSMETQPEETKSIPSEPNTNGEVNQGVKKYKAATYFQKKL